MNSGLLRTARWPVGTILAVTLLGGGVGGGSARPPQEAAEPGREDRPTADADALAACETERAALAERLTAVEAELAAARDAATGEQASLSEPLEPLDDPARPAAGGAEAAADAAPSVAPAVPLEPLAPGSAAAGPDPGALVALVEAWARAWSAQRVDDYLGHYAPDFRPRDGSSRDEWEARRRARVAEPAFIVVAISSPRVEVLAPDLAAVRFGQLYKSDTFLDEVHKVLVFASHDGGWKIVEERVE